MKKVRLASLFPNHNIQYQAWPRVGTQYIFVDVGWMDGWMDGQTDGWMDGWTGYWLVIEGISEAALFQMIPEG